METQDERAEALHRILLLERFGPLRNLLKERPAKPSAEVRVRRRVLLGDDEAGSK